MMADTMHLADDVEQLIDHVRRDKAAAGEDIPSKTGAVRLALEYYVADDGGADQ